MKKTALILAALISLSFASDYSDVLLVSNGNSPISLQIAQYFSQQRNVTHELGVYMPVSEKIKFAELNRTLLAPLKKYLNESGANINYIVLTKGIPLYTDEDDVFAAGNDMGRANASSVDSEIVLLNSKYESEIGGKGYTINPYYGRAEPFSHEKFGGYLATRLDGYDYADVKGMIDRAGAISAKDLASGQHILLDFRGIYGYQLSHARQMFSNASLKVYQTATAQANDEADSGLIAHDSNAAQKVSYYDTFGCYNLGGCNSSYAGVPKYAWSNGALVSIKYSFSARTTTYPTPVGARLVDSPRSYVADFIRAGATGGVGYAVEPMSSQVANPEPLAQSYLYGRNLAEILWSGVPSLSWSAVAFGDPKAQYPKLKNETAPSPAQPPVPPVPPAKQNSSNATKGNPNAQPANITQMPYVPDVWVPLEGQQSSAQQPLLDRAVALPVMAGLAISIAVALGLYAVSRRRGC